MVSEPILHLTQKQARVVKPRVDQIERLAVQAFQPRRHRLRGYLRRITHWIQSGNSLVTRDVRYFIPLNFVCHLGTSFLLKTFECAACLLAFPGHLWKALNRDTPATLGSRFSASSISA